LEERSRRNTIWQGLTRALAWLVGAAGVFLAMVYLREALLDLWIWFGVRLMERYKEEGVVGQAAAVDARITLLDFITIFVLAIIGVVAVVLIDYTFRRAAKKGQMLRSVLSVYGIVIAVIALSILLRAVA